MVVAIVGVTGRRLIEKQTEGTCPCKMEAQVITKN